MAVHSIPFRFALAALCFAAASVAASARPAQQNVLVIVADDLGVDQLEVYAEGSDYPSTPRLDALAQAGVLFRHAWASPICSPTRASLLTGRHAFRTGIGGLVREDTLALPLSEWTLPEVLDLAGESGRQHAFFGKWHLGNQAVGGLLAPNLAGFGHFAGSMDNFLSVGENYFHWDRVVDGVPGRVDRYAPSVNVDDALAWMNATQGPWLAVVSFNTPHTPLHEPPAELHTVDFSTGVTNRLMYKAMVEAMDTEIGRLLDGLGDRVYDTTVIFLGDNGTADVAGADDSRPGQSKWFLYEGGLRVPLIVTGPSVVSPGRECRAAVNVADVFLTVTELCSVDAPALLPPGHVLDSVSLVPYLDHAISLPQRAFNYAELFHPNGFGPYEYNCVAASDGEFKLIFSQDYRRHDRMALYDLRVDPYEEHNLFDDPPVSAEALGHHARLKDHVDALRGGATGP